VDPIRKKVFHSVLTLCLQLVNEQSATAGPSSANNIGLDADHEGLNKFNKRDSNYRMIQGKLVELLETTVAGEYPSQTSSYPYNLVRQVTKLVAIGVADAPSVYSGLERTAKRWSYTPRRTLEDALASSLLPLSRESPLTVVINGLGGTGKTELALQYAKVYKYRYEVILWIDARTEATIRSSFWRCARDLNLITETLDPQRIVETPLGDDPAVVPVLSWLRGRGEAHGEWLVIIDNADDLKTGIRQVIPHSESTRGSIIVTSRDRQCSEFLFGPGGSKQIEVGSMEPAEAVSLLLRHLGIGPETNLPLDKDVYELSLEVCNSVGHHPLWVHIAGSYLGGRQKLFSGFPSPRELLEEYVQILKSEHKDLILLKGGDAWHDQNRATVWDTSLEAIKQLFPHLRSVDLFVLLAHLNAVGGVHEDLFRLAAEGLAGEAANRKLENELPEWLFDCIQINASGRWDRIPYFETLAPLWRFGLVDHFQDDGGQGFRVTMHIMVQWRAKQHPVTVSAERPWNATHAAFLAAASYRILSEDCNTRFWQHLVPHLPPMGYLVSLNGTERKAAIWNALGGLYYCAGRWKEAEPLLARAVGEINNLVEEEDGLAGTFEMLSGLYRERGWFERAESIQRKDLETKQQLYGHDDLRTLASKANLASTLTSAGKLHESKALKIEVFNMRAQLLGDTDYYTLMASLNLAVTLRQLGEWDEAEKIVLGTLAKQQQQVAPGDLTREMLRAYQILVNIYICQSRFSEAESLCRKVIEGRTAVLGKSHPYTLWSMHRLAVTLDKLGRTSEAVAVWEEAITLMKKDGQGGDHWETQEAMHHLALALWRTGRTSEARKVIEEIICLRMAHGATDGDRPVVELIRLLESWTNTCPFYTTPFELTSPKDLA